jgi:hypothetical protein
MCCKVLAAALVLTTHRHLNAELVACSVHLVQLWQQRVVQGLQDCDLCGNPLQAATGHHGPHVSSKHNHEV